MQPKPESKESSIKRAFGLFSFELGGGCDFEEEQFARRVKQKKKRSKWLS